MWWLVRPFVRSFVRFVRSYGRSYAARSFAASYNRIHAVAVVPPSHDYSALAFDVCVPLSCVMVFVLSFCFFRLASLVPFHSVNVFGWQRMALCAFAPVFVHENRVYRNMANGGYAAAAVAADAATDASRLCTTADCVWMRRSNA